jgi:hypothetical protein
MSVERIITSGTLSVVAAIAVSGGAAWSADLSSITRHIRLSQGSGLGGSGIPKEDIDGWVTSWEDPRTESKYEFRASFATPRLRDSEKARYVRAGSIPFRITGDLFENRIYRGKRTRRRATGTAQIVVLDADGKKVASQSISVAKLCPT